MCMCDSVILSVCMCVFVYAIKPKRLKLKSPNLAHGLVHHDTSPINEYYIERSEVKITCRKVQKGDRVAGVSYALYRMPIM